MSLDTRELLTTGEVARLLGSSRQHVVDMCERGDLRFVRAGSHRRIHRDEVDALLNPSETHDLTREQERSLWLHRALLARLVVEPEETLAVGRENLRRLLDQHPDRGMTAHWLREWAQVLRSGVDAVAEILTSCSPLALELRQNSPFAGALSQQDRAQVLAAFTRHWRTEHGDAPAPDADTGPSDAAGR